MRRRCSLSQVYARIEPGVPTVPAPVIIGLVPDDYAVLSANGESAAVVVMRDVITNYRIRCPYLKSIDRPPSSCLRIIVTGTPFAADVARYSRRVRAGGTLYKDATAISRPAYPVAGDNAIIAGERNPTALTNVVDDTPMAGPDLVPLGDKDRSNWWPCSGHRPPNIVLLDGPVLTAGGTDSPPPAVYDRTVCHPPVITRARDGRKADRWSIVPHVKCQVLHAPIISPTLQQVIRRHRVDP